MLLQPYWFNKVVSLGLPLAVLAVLLFFFAPTDPRLWWVLVVCAHTLGYVHFLLGFAYQNRALYKRRAGKEFVVLTSLTIVTVALSYWCIATGNLAALAIFAVGYFILHGTMNEHTLMERQLPHPPPARYIVPVALYVIPFFLLSLTSPSFFFTPQLQFLNPPPEVAVRYLSHIVSLNVLLLVSLASWAVFMVVVPLRLLVSGSYRWGILLLVAFTLGIVGSITYDPLPYVMLYYLALSYHFISWSLFFYQEYQAHHPERIPAYIRDHLLIGVPLATLSVLAFYHIGQGVSIHQTVFNGAIFITLSMIHISTSLLNERWFKRLCLL